MTPKAKRTKKQKQHYHHHHPNRSWTGLKKNGQTNYKTSVGYFILSLRNSSSWRTSKFGHNKATISAIMLIPIFTFHLLFSHVTRGFSRFSWMTACSIRASKQQLSAQSISPSLGSVTMANSGAFVTQSPLHPRIPRQSAKAISRNSS